MSVVENKVLLTGNQDAFFQRFSEAHQRSET